MHHYIAVRRLCFGSGSVHLVGLSKQLALEYFDQVKGPNVKDFVNQPEGAGLWTS